MKSNLDFEAVHVELSWNDGPREGVADVLGVPHRFKSLFDETDDEWLSTFFQWPIGKDSLALEIEAWNIFVAWNKQNEGGNVDVGSHPGVGGISYRYDEIAEMLGEERNNTPNNGVRATAEFLRLERDERYSIDGPDYKLRWVILDGI